MAFVVDDGKSGLVDDRNALFFGDVDHLRKGGLEKHARDLDQFGARLVGKGNGRIDALGAIDHRFDVSLVLGNLFGERRLVARTPKVGAVAVAVVDGHAGETALFDPVDDGVVILVLHPNLVDLENEMRAVAAGDAVELAIGRLVPLEATGAVEIGVLETAVPSTLEDLKRLLHQLGTIVAQRTVKQGKEAVFHLFLGGIARKTQPHRLFEVLALVGNEVEGYLARAQDVLGRVGTVAHLEDHRIVVFARDIVGKTQRIGAQIGLPALGHGGRQNGGHRKERGRLIKIVDDTQIFESHTNLPCKYLPWRYSAILIIAPDTNGVKTAA